MRVTVQSQCTYTLDCVPAQDWRRQLLKLLERWPQAIVGEIGIDRAAKVPDTSSATSYEHQWSLFKDQMSIAAELSRPVLILSLPIMP